MSTDHNSGKNGNDQGKRLTPLDTMPKMVAQITISLHQGGRVSGNMPTDMKVTMFMLGEFFKQIGPSITYSQPSPIVAPPVGLVIPGVKK